MTKAILSTMLRKLPKYLQYTDTTLDTYYNARKQEDLKMFIVLFFITFIAMGVILWTKNSYLGTAIFLATLVLAVIVFAYHVTTPITIAL